MSTEARTIRPFTGLERFEEALREASLHFGQDTCRPGESVRSELNSHEFNLRPLDLEWAADQDSFAYFKNQLRQGLDETEVRPSAVSLLVVAETSYLKEAEVLINHSLSELSTLNRVVHLHSKEERPSPFKAWRHGFQVDVHVLLNQSIPPSPLRPHRKGTWFARESFEVKTTHSSERLFRPIPLNEENRDRLNLPNGTTRYVVLGEHDPLQKYEEQAEEPELYIDEDLLSELNASSSSAASRAIQLDLALHFMTCVIHKASRNLSENDKPFEDISGSLVARILQLCAGSARDKEHMRTLYRRIQSSPEKVIAWAEDRLSIQGALLENVKGAD